MYICNQSANGNQCSCDWSVCCVVIHSCILSLHLVSYNLCAYESLHYLCLAPIYPHPCTVCLDIYMSSCMHLMSYTEMTCGLSLEMWSATCGTMLYNLPSLHPVKPRYVTSMHPEYTSKGKAGLHISSGHKFGTRLHASSSLLRIMTRYHCTLKGHSNQKQELRFCSQAWQ